MTPAPPTGHCTRCRTTLPPAAAFCTGCGAPTGPWGTPTPYAPPPGWHHEAWPGSAPMAAQAPAGRGNLAWVAIGVLVLLLIAGVAAVVRPELFGLGSASPVAVPAPSSGFDPSAAAPAVDPGEPTTTSDPAQQLEAQVEEDRTVVEAATDQWVPQLSSKRPGMVAEGRSWDATAILQDHQQLRSRFASVRLLWSGDWSVFSATDYWVTVVGRPYATAAEANAWCIDQGLPTDDCFAKKLSHSGGSAGTTVRR